jgi:hypothetical protein
MRFVDGEQKAPEFIILLGFMVKIVRENQLTAMPTICSKFLKGYFYHSAYSAV